MKKIDLDKTTDWDASVIIDGAEIGVNLYELQLRLGELAATFPLDAPTSERYKAYRTMLADEFGIKLKGLDQVNAFFLRFNPLIEELEKKAVGATGSPPASPASTDSTLSDSAPTGCADTTPTSAP
jgi:hypothetical protein